MSVEPPSEAGRQHRRRVARLPGGAGQRHRPRPSGPRPPARHRYAAGGYAIAKAIGAPLSTTYLIIDELVERGLLVRHGEASSGLAPASTISACLCALARFPHRGEPADARLCRSSARPCRFAGATATTRSCWPWPPGPAIASAAGTRVPAELDRVRAPPQSGICRTPSAWRSSSAPPSRRPARTPRPARRRSPGFRGAFAKRLAIQISEAIRASPPSLPDLRPIGGLMATSRGAGRAQAGCRQAHYGEAVRAAAREDRAQSRLAARLIERSGREPACCSIAMELRCDCRDASVPAFGSSLE